MNSQLSAGIAMISDTASTPLNSSKHNWIRDVNKD